MNPDSIRIAIFGVRSADAINPDSIQIEVLVRTHLKGVCYIIRKYVFILLQAKLFEANALLVLFNDKKSSLDTHGNFNTTLCIDKY